MTTRTKIKEILKGTLVDQTVNVKGWVRTFRNNSFIAINDGSSINNIQAVVNFETANPDTLKRLTPGACIGVTGKLVASQGKGQTVEIIVSEIIVYGDSESDIAKPNSYPLQPKAHSLEFLREIAHLRFRTSTFGAIFRVRHTLAYAIHSFFNERKIVDSQT